MRFVSTRGQSEPVGFLQAAWAGRAPDGGLYLPEAWPELDPKAIARLAARPYGEALGEVLAAFAGDELERDAPGDIGREVAATFAHAATAPLQELYPNVWLLELFHGPTLSAADVSMQVLARLHERQSHGHDETVSLMMAGTAEEAAAAVQAFAGLRQVKLAVIFPARGSTLLQRRLIAGSGAANIKAVAVEGGLQDCAGLARALLADQALAEAGLRDIGPANIVRIAADIAVLVHAAARLGAPLRPVSFAVPGGDFAMGVAAYGARRMGLPVSRIVAACNINDAAARVFQDGRYAASPLQQTRTPALDVQAPLNFERLYAEAVNREALETRRALDAFADIGTIDMPPSARTAFGVCFAGASVGEDDTARAMLATLNETGVLVEPHTAVILAVAQRLAARERAVPMVALGVAHPAHYAEAVKAATGVEPEAPARAAAGTKAVGRIERLPAEPDAVAAYVRDFLLA
jgi:threonine synthase